MDGDQLEALIRDLGLSRFVGAEEFHARALDGSLPDDSLCLTFDDGLRCQIDVALPVLDTLELTAFWFVNTAMFVGPPPMLEVYRYFRSTAFETVDDFYATFLEAVREKVGDQRLESLRRDFEARAYFAASPIYSDNDRWFRYLRDLVFSRDEYEALMDYCMQSVDFAPDTIFDRLWLSREMIATLARKEHVVGLHSHTHPTRIDLLSPDDQEREYRTNFAILADILGSPPTTMSHPSGFYDAHTLEVLSGLGIGLGFRADMTPGASTLELPRQDHALLLAR